MTNKTKTWLAVVATLAIVAIALVAGPAIASSWNANVPPATPTAPAGDEATGNTPDNNGMPRYETPTDPADEMPMKAVPAPIESVDVRVAESAPPQYFVHIQYGLPSGCARPSGYEVAREGNTIRIDVSILQPAADDVVCTMIYGLGEYDVALDSDFESGQTYYVDVNGTVKEFVAQ